MIVAFATFILVPVTEGIIDVFLEIRYWLYAKKKKNCVIYVIRTAVFCALGDSPGSILAFPLLV
jgi:hypothetical protein